MKSWTITRRIVTGFAIIVSLSTAMGILTWNRMCVIDQHAEELSVENVPGMAQSADLLQGVSAAHLILFRGVLATNLEERKACAAKVKELAETNAKLVGDIEKLCRDSKENSILEQLKQARQKYLNAIGPITQLSDAGKSQEALARLLTSGNDAFTNYDAVAMALNDLETDHGTGAAATIRENAQSTKVRLGSTVLLDFIIGVLLSFLVVGGLNRMLRTISSSVGDGAE